MINSYVIVYDKKTEEFVNDYILENINLGDVCKLFNVEDQDPILRCDYDIGPEQEEFFLRHLGHIFDFNRYDYQFGRRQG